MQMLRRSIAILLFGMCMLSATSATAQVKIGDTIAILADGTQVMAGSQPVAILNRGARTQVKAVNGTGKWVLVGYKMNGAQLSGWVNANVVYVVANAQAQTQYYQQPTYQQPTYYYNNNNYDYDYDDGGHWHNQGHWDRHGDHYDYHDTSHWDYDD